MEDLNRPGARLLVTLREEIRLEDYLAKKFPRIIRSQRKQVEARDEDMVGKLYSLGYRPFEAEGINFARTSWVRVTAWYRLN